MKQIHLINKLLKNILLICVCVCVCTLLNGVSMHGGQSGPCDPPELELIVMRVCMACWY